MPGVSLKAALLAGIRPAGLTLVVALAVACGRGVPPEPAAARDAAHRLEFSDRANTAGLRERNVSGSPDQIALIDQNGQGAAFLDAEGDGDMDLFLVGGSSLDRWKSGRNPGNRLYENVGGGRFVDRTEQAGVGGNSWGSGVAAADFDNDGDTDLLVTTALGGDVLFENDGTGRFEDVTERAGIAGGDHWSSSAAFADFDGDGWLDLYVSRYVGFDPDHMPRAEADGAPCTYKGVETGCGPWNWQGDGDALYRNVPGRASRRFEMVPIEAGFESSRSCRGFGVVAADFDRDGDPDIYVGCDVGPNLYLENLGGWKFREKAAQAGLALSASGEEESGMGVAGGDVDADGYLDLFVTNFAGQKNTLYANLGGRFADRSAPAGIAEAHRNELGWGCGIVDLDNDGVPDLFVANGHIYPQVTALGDPEESYDQQMRFFAGRGDGSFQESRGAVRGGAASFSRRGAAVGDYDNDGDLDILVVNHNAPPSLLENLKGQDRGAVVLHLVGGPSTRDAIGAVVTAKVGERTLVREVLPHQGFQSSNDPRVFLGLDGQASTGEVRIQWPSGNVSVLNRLTRGAYRLAEGEREPRLEPVPR